MPEGRKGRGSVTPYSTSSEESEAVEVRIRRRKKRKRPVGGLEKELRQKVAWIQDALKRGDRDRLGQLAASKGGLLSDEVYSIYNRPALSLHFYLPY